MKAEETRSFKMPEPPSGSRYVPLNGQQYAVVDEMDFELVSEHLWTLHSAGYASNSRIGLMHRFILGSSAKYQVDHINGDRLDNRRSNLRLATHAENCYNKRPRGDRKYKGISKATKGRWAAYICHNYKQHNLGLFDTQEEAAMAYDEAARHYHGEFAYQNFGSKKVVRRHA